MSGSKGSILLDEEFEGEFESTADLLFVRIGASVSVKPSESRYDLKDPPKRPLAISEKYGLMFVGHSEGFFVNRTRDVIKLAKETKEIVETKKKEKVSKGGWNCPTVQSASIVDARIGNVSILALSMDSLSLAATVDGDIHLFSVHSLVKKSEISPVSCSPDKSGSVKDLQWCKNQEGVFFALMNSGSLFSGNVNGHLKKVEQNVDAVDWSIEGNLVAVAESNTLRILSEVFETQSVMDFMSESKVANLGHRLKVDSLKWATCRSIIVGCMQQDEDGLEIDYLVQVIISGEGGFQASSKPVIVSFIELFSGIDDQVSGGGPHLFAKYLERWRVAVLANRRNMDSNIVLLELHEDVESRKSVALELEEEKYTPRIELQENGDENFILGLDVDKISIYENLSLIKEGGDMELTPYCTMVCLTSEGKIVLFHIARSSDPRTHLPVSSEFDISAIQEGNSHAVLSTLSEPPVAPSFKNDKQISSIVETKQDKKVFSVVEPKDNVSLALNNVTNAQATVNSSTEMATNQMNSAPFVGLPSARPFVSVSALGPVLPNKPGFFPSYGSFVNPIVSDCHVGNLGSNFTSFSPTSSIGVVSGMRPISGMQVQFPSSESFVRGDAAATKFFPSVTKDAPTQTNLSNLSGVSWPFLSEDYQHHRAPPSLSSSMEISGPLYNVSDMVEDLDRLLVDIEQEGDFVDKYLKSAVLSLEKGFESISEKYKICKGEVSELTANVQHLQDKMVQVSAREAYMDGLVKQASNSQYWDIWNRQILGPEFELKQQQILKLNQDLRNRLIELERHFNALELEKFGENSGTSKVWRSMHTSEFSRRIQTVHSLYSTVVSQLSVAEHLSDCLAEQMTTLKIVSPSTEENSFARDLLESIGVTCPSDLFESPDVKGTVSSISAAKHQMSIASNTFQKPAKKNKANISRCLEPESGRRRRDSLDRSLVSFEPQKTTVKRMTQQEYSRIGAGYFRGAAGETSSNQETTKEASKLEQIKASSPSIYKHPEIVQSNRDMSSLTVNLRSSRPAPASPLKPSPVSRSSFDAAENMSLTSATIPNLWNSHAANLLSETGVRPQASILGNISEHTGALSSSMVNVQTNQNASAMIKAPGNFSSLSASDKGIGLKFDSLTSKSVPPSISISSQIPVPPATFSPSLVTQLPSSAFPTQKSAATTLSEGASNISATLEQAPSISISSKILVPPTPSSPSLVTSLSSAFPAQKSAATMPSEGTSNISTTLELPSSTLIASSPIPSASSHVPSIYPASSIMQQNSASHPAIVSSPAPTSPSVPLFSGPQFGTTGSAQVSTASTSLTPAFTLSTAMSNTIPSGSSSEVSTASISLTPAFTLSTAMSNTIPSGSSSVSLVSSSSLKEKEPSLNLDENQGDEMEEEAPDASSSLDLGGLGGLGLFSTPTTSPKDNPFGGSLGSSASPMSSPFFPSTSPGQLFRPVSFTIPSIQPVQPSQPATSTGVSGPFSGFGQPPQIGGGQQALGSVLGSFGQSRQLGSGQGFGFGSVGFGGSSVAAPAGSSFSPTSGFVGAATGGFAAVASSGIGFAGAAGSGFGFAGAATGGAFSSLGSGAGGFAGVASGGGFGGAAAGAGGFGGAAPGAGGFGGAAPGGGGFGAAAPGGGGFGAAAPGGGGFGVANSGGLGSRSGTSKPPAELLMKMRK